MTIHTLSTIYKSVTTTHLPTLNSIINLFTFRHSGGGIKWYFKICMSLKISKAELSFQSLLLVIHKVSTGIVYSLCPLLCCMLSLLICRLLRTYGILNLCCTYHIVFPSYAHQLVCTQLCCTGSSPHHPALCIWQGHQVAGCVASLSLTCKHLIGLLGGFLKPHRGCRASRRFLFHFPLPSFRSDSLSKAQYWLWSC